MFQGNSKTTTEFFKKVHHKYQDEFEILSEFKGQNEYITVKHNNCDSIYEIKPNYFMFREDNCRICRKTNKFKEEIYKQRKDEYSLIGYFVNNKTPVTIKHRTCNYIYEVLPTTFLQGTKCKRCSIQEKYKTTEEFIQDICSETGDEYLLESEYKAYNEPVIFRHTKCNNLFELTPFEFMQKYRCPHCRKKKKISKEEFEQRLFETVAEEYLLVSNFVNVSTPVDLFHDACGYIWSVRPLHFFDKGNRCPKCQGLVKKTQEQIEQQVRELTNNSFSVIGTYENTHSLLEIKHHACDQTFEVRPQNFLANPRCPNCEGVITGKTKRTHEEFENFVKKETGTEYSVLTKYTHSHDLIKMKHNECGMEYSVRPSDFIHQQHRCPVCAREKLRQKLMDSHDDFIKKIMLPSKDYEVLDTYQGAHQKIRFLHLSCGKVFERTPNQFKYGKGCPNCKIKTNKRKEHFLQRLEEIFGESYEVIDEFKNYKTKVKIKHPTCGEIFEKTPSNMLSSIGCPRCNKKVKLMTTEEFQQKVSNDRKSQYTVLSEYLGSQLPVLMKHEECGNIIEITPGGFFQKRGCTECPSEKR